MALGVVGVEEGVWRVPFYDLGQLPSQIHRVLHAELDTLSTVRRMYVRRIAGQEDASFAVACGLTSGIGEPRDRGGTVDAVIGPVHGGERLAEIAQRGFVGASDVLFGHQDAYTSPILQLAERMDAERIAADAPFRRLHGQLDLVHE